VVLGALVGIPLAIWLAPRRVLVPLATLVLLIGVYVAEGAAGASGGDRSPLRADDKRIPLSAGTPAGGWRVLSRGARCGRGRRVRIRARRAGGHGPAPRACVRRSPTTRTSTRGSPRPSRPRR